MITRTALVGLLLALATSSGSGKGFAAAGDDDAVFSVSAEVWPQTAVTGSAVTFSVLVTNEGPASSRVVVLGSGTGVSIPTLGRGRVRVVGEQEPLRYRYFPRLMPGAGVDETQKHAYATLGLTAATREYRYLPTLDAGVPHHRLDDPSLSDSATNWTEKHHESSRRRSL